MSSKKTWDLFAVADRLVPPLRLWHPKGISISWYAFDRGCRQALCRLLRRRHLVNLASIEDDTERVMASLLDWTLDSACCDHDVQNGLSKGCSAGVENFAQLTKDVYKGVRSLRAVYDKLVETMPTWVHKVRITESAFDQDDVRRSWECLGVKPWLADSLAHINLRLEDGAVFCHSNLWEQEDPMGHLGNCLLGAYKISGFSATRFLSMGTSCKCLSTALAVGIMEHVAYCRAMPDVGEYYVHCVDLLNAPAKKFVFTTALATKVTDPLHAALLRDDRVAKKNICTLARCMMKFAR